MTRSLLRSILKVRVSGPLELELWFDTGEVLKRRFSSLAKKGGVFSVLNDPKYCARVRGSHGTIKWPGELDLCPDALYDKGKAIRAPGHVTRCGRKTNEVRNQVG